MYIKQISIFVENTSGRLAEITSIIAENQIDIRALSIADTTDFGILRIIVDRPEDAEKALKQAGLTVSITNVIAIEIFDKPGGFAKAMVALANAGISIEYMYAFVSRADGKACVILRVEDSEDSNERALKVLQDDGVHVLNGENVYTI